MKVSACLTCLTTTGSSLLGGPLALEPAAGVLEDDHVAALGLEPNHGVSLSTSTRSPIRMVCSIEPDGITNAWTRKVLRTSAISSATATSSGISLTADR